MGGEWTLPDEEADNYVEQDETLSPDQQTAVDAILAGEGPFFLTGKAGTGKSWIIRYLRHTLPNTRVTAMTGMAAQLIQGTTAHSFLSIHPRKGVVPSRKAQERLEYTDLLIIDEISMASAEFIDQIFQRFGMTGCYPKLLLVGDFAQLPPVNGKYAFENPRWQEFQQLTLLTNHRQTNDQTFLDALNDLRNGKLTPRLKSLIESRTVQRLPLECTHLYPHRDIVERINHDRLKSLQTPAHTFMWDFQGPNVTEDNFHQFIQLHNIDVDRFRFVSNLTLKEGARIVMLNNDVDGRWVNGSTGKVMEIHGEESVTVGLDDGTMQTVYPTKEDYYGPDIKDPICCVVQFPMMLAWALTIHKCVAGDTLVHTNRGLQEIQDICRFAPGYKRTCKISGIEAKTFGYDARIKEGYRGIWRKSKKVVTRQGFELEGSAEHKVMVWDSKSWFFWKPLAELDKGDYVLLRSGCEASGCDVISRRNWIRPTPKKKGTYKPYNVPEALTVSVAWMLGILVGDGSYMDKKDGRIELNNSDPYMKNAFAKIWRRSFATEVTFNPKRVYVHSKGARSLLYYWGLRYSTVPGKTIPWAVLQSPIDVQKAFIQGLFDTDGGVSKARIHFTTVSAQLSRYLQIMLMNLGILASRKCTRPATDKWNAAWQLSIVGRHAVKFVSEIGFRRPYKKRLSKWRYGKLKTQVPKSNVGKIPGGRDLIKQLRAYMRLIKGWQWSDSHKRDSGIYGLISRIASGTVELRNEHLPYILKEIPKAEGCPVGKLFRQFVDFGWLLDPVQEIKDGTCEMHDLEVKDEHQYVANSFVVHNSQGATLDRVGVCLDNHFASGQSYVALSRCKTAAGLFLTGRFTPVPVDLRVSKFI